MRITVFARRFEGTGWKRWEHICNEEDAAAVLDSARAKAFARSFTTVLTDGDYLEGARYIFDRAYGTPEKPAEGDVRVTSAQVSVVAQSEPEDVIHHPAHKRSA